MPDRKTVMISSTALDLPEHRQEVMDACMRLGIFFQTMMEHLTATRRPRRSRASPAMADRADIYVGIFAHRYGYVPTGAIQSKISVTEMEYNRAVERRIPRLIFLMDKDHPFEASTMSKWARARTKLETLNKTFSRRNVLSASSNRPTISADWSFRRLVPPPRTRSHHIPLRQRHPRRARGLHRASVHPVADAPAGRPAGGTQSAHRLGGGQDPWGFGNPKGLHLQHRRHRRDGQEYTGFVEVVQRDRAAGDGAAGRPDVVELLRERRDLRELCRPGACVCDRPGPEDVEKNTKPGEQERCWPRSTACRSCWCSTGWSAS